MKRMIGLVVTVAIVVAACSDDGAGAGPGAGGGGGDKLPGERVDAYPSVHWPNIHRDPRNSDVIDIEGPRELESMFQHDPGVVIAVMTVGPTGNLYATTSDDPNGSGCHLYAYDAATGDMRWCSDEVGGGAVSSSALSDVDGHVYLADQR